MLLADVILSDESKQKVILIIDIVRVTKLLGGQPPIPKEFDMLYDAKIHDLQMHQHNLQIALNSKEYEDRVYGRIPPNF